MAEAMATVRAADLVLPAGPRPRNAAPPEGGGSGFAALVTDLAASGNEGGPASAQGRTPKDATAGPDGAPATAPGESDAEEAEAAPGADPLAQGPVALPALAPASTWPPASPLEAAGPGSGFPDGPGGAAVSLRAAGHDPSIGAAAGAPVSTSAAPPGVVAGEAAIGTADAAAEPGGEAEAPPPTTAGKGAATPGERAAAGAALADRPSAPTPEGSSAAGRAGSGIEAAIRASRAATSPRTEAPPSGTAGEEAPHPPRAAAAAEVRAPSAPPPPAAASPAAPAGRAEGAVLSFLQAEAARASPGALPAELRHDPLRGPEGGPFGVAAPEGGLPPGRPPLPEGPEAARLIARQLADQPILRTGGTAEVSLHPEELGPLRLTVEGSEGQLRLVIEAARPETAEVLRRHLEALRQELRQEGLGSVGVSIGGGDARRGEEAGSRRGGSGGPGPESALATSPAGAAPAATPPVARPRAAGGQLDLRY